MYLWSWLLPIAYVLSCIIHIIITTHPLPRGRIPEIALLHGFFWLFGIGYCIAFYAVGFEPLSSQIAKDFTWPSGSFFQEGSALALLSLGVLGFFSLFFRASFWLATIILALLMGWTELGTVIIHGATPGQKALSWIYDAGITALMAIFLICYRVRVGRERFWNYAGKASDWIPPSVR